MSAPRLADVWVTSKAHPAPALTTWVTFAHLKQMQITGSLAASIASHVLAPQLQNLTLDLHRSDNLVPDMPWSSLTTLAIDGAEEVRMHAAMFDGLTNLTHLQLRHSILWVDGVAPTLASVENLRILSVEAFAKFPDHALPALKTLHAGHPEFRPPLRSVPVACMPTLQSISARIHPRLVESLARMRHLKSINAKYMDLDGDVPLKVWQLEYVPGNPVWAAIPKTVCKGGRVARKIVVMVVAAVDDITCMVHDIMGVARWCFRDCELEPIKYKHWVPPVKPLDVEVLLQISAGAEMCERVQQLFDEVVEKDKFVGRVTVIGDVALAS